MYESFLEYRFHLIRINADKQRRALRTADMNRREERQEYRKIRSQLISSRGVGGGISTKRNRAHDDIDHDNLVE